VPGQERGRTKTKSIAPLSAMDRSRESGIRRMPCGYCALPRDLDPGSRDAISEAHAPHRRDGTDRGNLAFGSNALRLCALPPWPRAQNTCRADDLPVRRAWSVCSGLCQLTMMARGRSDESRPRARMEAVCHRRTEDCIAESAYFRNASLRIPNQMPRPRSVRRDRAADMSRDCFAVAATIRTERYSRQRSRRVAR